jgi:hypothetical protein
MFPTEWRFFIKLSPQVSPFPVPIFGVNSILITLVHIIALVPAVTEPLKIIPYDCLSLST